jgi:hypothetical protein
MGVYLPSNVINDTNLAKSMASKLEHTPDIIFQSIESKLNSNVDIQNISNLKICSIWVETFFTSLKSAKKELDSNKKMKKEKKSNLYSQLHFSIEGANIVLSKIKNEYPKFYSVLCTRYDSNSLEIISQDILSKLDKLMSEQSNKKQVQSTLNSV